MTSPHTNNAPTGADRPAAHTNALPAARQFFETDGLLAHRLPNFLPRPQQMAMAHAVEEGLTHGRHVMVEAGTGVGKSLAYLIPAAVWATREKKKVVVATFTKALQEQLVQKDLPIVHAILKDHGQTLRFALLMGSDNYLCLCRLHRALERAPELFNQNEPALLQRLMDWAPDATSGLRARLPVAVPHAVWETVCRDPDLCLGRRCPVAGECLYRKDLAQARDADILVVNHHLYFANMASGGAAFKADAAVFDEAHTLPESASHFFGLSVNARQAKRLFDDILNPATRRGLLSRMKGAHPAWRKDMDAALDAARNGADATFTGFLRFLHAPTARPEHPQQNDAPAADPAQHLNTDDAPTDGAGNGAAAAAPTPGARRVKTPQIAPDHLSGPLARLADLLLEAVEEAASLEEDVELTAIARRAAVMAGDLTAFLAVDSDTHAYWVEHATTRRGAVTSVHKMPLDVAPILREKLFGAGAPVIVTSATLAVDGGFGSAKARIGMDQGDGLLLASPFDHRSNVLLLADAALPDPGKDPRAHEDAVMDAATRIFDAVPGGIFLLFTSWQALRRAHARLAAHAGHRPFFKQGEKPPFDLVRDFKAAGNGVLFGTDTFWQGVDVPGRALSCVVITKLPFLNPSTPLEEARVERLTAQGANAFMDYTLPNAVIKFRQGVGRLIRSQSDFGAVVILDPRIRTKRYGAVFARSIPPCARATDVDDIRAFFARKGGEAASPPEPLPKEFRNNNAHGRHNAHNTTTPLLQPEEGAQKKYMPLPDAERSDAEGRGKGRGKTGDHVIPSSDPGN